MLNHDFCLFFYFSGGVQSHKSTFLSVDPTKNRKNCVSASKIVVPWMRLTHWKRNKGSIPQKKFKKIKISGMLPKITLGGSNCFLKYWRKRPNNHFKTKTGWFWCKIRVLINFHSQMSWYAKWTFWTWRFWSINNVTYAIL